MATTRFPDPITNQYNPAAWALVDIAPTGTVGNFITYPIAQDALITFPNTILADGILGSSGGATMTYGTNINTGTVSIGSALQTGDKLLLGSSVSTTTIAGTLKTPSITSTANLTVASPASTTMTIANADKTTLFMGSGARDGTAGAGNTVTHRYSGGNGALIGNNVTINNGDQNKSSTFIQCGPGLTGNRSDGNVEIKTGVFNTGEVRVGQFTSDTNKTTTVINGDVNLGNKSTSAVTGSMVTTSGLLIKQVVPCPLSSGVGSIETVIGNPTFASAMSTTFNQKFSAVDLNYIPCFVASTENNYVTQYFEIVVSASQGVTASGKTFVYKGSFALQKEAGLVTISSINTLFSFGGNALIRWTDNGGGGGTLAIQTCANNTPSLNTNFVCALMSYPCMTFTVGNIPLLQGFAVTAI
jgi:hypothetical protein